VPYYTKAFAKLPAELTVVTSMETLLAELEEMAAAGRKVDMCLVGPRTCCLPRHFFIFS
jgi:hypothetical protein